MPTKKEPAETKIVKAAPSKAAKKDEGASKVKIKAVDKAIIEAQAAKTKKTAAKTTATKAAAPKKEPAKKTASAATAEKKTAAEAPKKTGAKL
ncbi:MAG: DNA-binding protein, partial [Firmicutes bacterium]|nr:DNA-binding protein [Bacillota bacterium]